VFPVFNIRILLNLITCPGRAAVKRHAALCKAESAVITQIRTGRIGLAAFLNKARVPEVESPACQCGWARWFIQRQLLPQFRLAEELLYGGEGEEPE